MSVWSISSPPCGERRNAINPVDLTAPLGPARRAPGVAHYGSLMAEPTDEAKAAVRTAIVKAIELWRVPEPRD
jgi:hypothetical protein